MKPAYQVFLPGTTREKDAVRDILTEAFSSVIFITEEKYPSLAGPQKNIRAYVELDKENTLTEKQLQALTSLDLEAKDYLFFQYWEEGELDALQEKQRAETRNLWEKLINQKYTQAQYFLCSFRQNMGDGFSLGDGSITVHFVYPESFPLDQYAEAEQRARQLEADRYEERDFNLQIEPRVAESMRQARSGIFLDFDESRAEWYRMGRV